MHAASLLPIERASLMCLRYMHSAHIFLPFLSSLLFSKEEGGGGLHSSARVINCQGAFPRQDNRLDWLRHAVPVSAYRRSKSIRQDSVTHQKKKRGENEEEGEEEEEGK